MSFGCQPSSDLDIIKAGPRQREHLLLHLAVSGQGSHGVDRQQDLQLGGLAATPYDPVDLAPVQPNGIIDMDRLAGLICDKTAAVSVMLANNEIGTLQPVADIAKLCQPRGIVLHSDAAQAVGKIPIDVGEL